MASSWAELRPGSAGDPESLTTAAVLAASIEVEQTASLRRSLLPRLAAIGAVVWVVSATTRFVPPTTLAVDLSILASIWGAAVLAELSTRHKLRDLIAGHRQP